MRKIITALFVLLLLFLGLLYWSVSSTDKTFDTAQLPDIKEINTFNFRTVDSVVVIPSTLYKADRIKVFMQGEHYRKTWETPIKVPVVFLDSLKGGMTILKKGGGKQTHSLKLESLEGVNYTLRSINKDPEALIPQIATTLGLQNIIVDGISGQHPYGAVLAAELAKHALVLSTRPKIVFIPKQELLDNYNANFGNRLYLLEYETESKNNWTPINHVKKIVDTDNLQKLKLNPKNTVKIDKSALIRVRLFDMLIGDWDRHSKQYGWVILKDGRHYKGIPLAGDRDNAFFKTEGIIPSLLSTRYTIPELQSFEKTISYMPGLVYPFDRYFLYNTPEYLFVAEAERLQKLLNDKVIDDALKVWPQAIQDLDAKEITEKIKARRTHLVRYAKAFKKAIDNKGLVNEPLVGSEKLELPQALLQCFDCE